MPRVPEILVFSGPCLGVSGTDRAATEGPPTRPILPLAGPIRVSVSCLVREHSLGPVSGPGTRSRGREVVTYGCRSVQRRLRPRPLPEQPVLAQGHAEGPVESPPPRDRPPVRGLSDGFGAAEGAELRFPGSPVPRSGLPVADLRGLRSWSRLPKVHVLRGQGLVLLAGGSRCSVHAGRRSGWPRGMGRTLARSTPDGGQTSPATSLPFSRALLGTKWPSAAPRETRPPLEGGDRHTPCPCLL